MSTSSWFKISNLAKLRVPVYCVCIEDNSGKFQNDQWLIRRDFSPPRWQDCIARLPRWKKIDFTFGNGQELRFNTRVFGRSSTICFAPFSLVFWALLYSDWFSELLLYSDWILSFVPRPIRIEKNEDATSGKRFALFLLVSELLLRLRYSDWFSDDQSEYSKADGATSGIQRVSNEFWFWVLNPVASWPLEKISP